MWDLKCQLTVRMIYLAQRLPYEVLPHRSVKSSTLEAILGTSKPTLFQPSHPAGVHGRISDDFDVDDFERCCVRVASGVCIADEVALSPDVLKSCMRINLCLLALLAPAPARASADCSCELGRICFS